MDYTKAQAKRLTGCDTDAALARLLNVTRQAASKWRDDEPLPGAQLFELFKKRPELFKDNNPDDAQREVA